MILFTPRLLSFAEVHEVRTLSAAPCFRFLHRALQLLMAKRCMRSGLTDKNDDMRGVIEVFGAYSCIAVRAATNPERIERTFAGAIGYGAGIAKCASIEMGWAKYVGLEDLRRRLPRTCENSVEATS